MAFRQMGIYVENKKILALGIDPGRDKTGFAFVNLQGVLILSGIFNTNELNLFMSYVSNHDMNKILKWQYENFLNENFSGGFDLKFIALGNGTHHKKFHELLKNYIEPEKIILVDEKNSTIEARALYWKIHKPGFFKKLLPEKLRVPDRVLDDLAACVIVLRAISLNEVKL